MQHSLSYVRSYTISIVCCPAFLQQIFLTHILLMCFAFFFANFCIIGFLDSLFPINLKKREENDSKLTKCLGPELVGIPIVGPNNNCIQAKKERIFVESNCLRGEHSIILHQYIVCLTFKLVYTLVEIELIPVQIYNLIQLLIDFWLTSFVYNNHLEGLACRTYHPLLLWA